MGQENKETESNPIAEPTESNPTCPFCGDDPMVLSAKQVAFPNGVLSLVVWCANRKCRKVVTVSFMGTVKQNSSSGLILPRPS